MISWDLLFVLCGCNHMLRGGGVHKKKPEATAEQLTGGRCLAATEWLAGGGTDPQHPSSTALHGKQCKDHAATAQPWATCTGSPYRDRYPTQLPNIFEQQSHPLWPVNVWLCHPFWAGGAGCCAGPAVGAAPPARPGRGRRPHQPQPEGLPQQKAGNTPWAAPIFSVRYIITWCVRSAFKSF